MIPRLLACVVLLSVYGATPELGATLTAPLLPKPAVQCVDDSTKELKSTQQGLPRFNRTGCGDDNECMLPPFTCVMGSTMKCTGYYSLNCSAVGADEYRFYYWDISTGSFVNATNDECIYVDPDHPEVMTFIPNECSLKRGNGRTYMCNASNRAGYITLTQMVKYTVTSSWLLQGGTLQSTGEIPLSGGSAVGYCQAQRVVDVMDIKYFVCRVDRALVNASNAACFYERKLLQCCECGKTCIDVANLTATKERSSHSCRVETRVSGDFVCLGQKQIFNGSEKINVPSEFIGELSFVNQPSPTSRILIIGTASGGGGVFLLMIAVVLAFVVGCVLYWRRRRRHQPEYGYRRHQGGADDPIRVRVRVSGEQGASIPGPGVMVSEITKENEDHLPHSKSQYSPSQKFDQMKVEMSFLMTFVTKMAPHWLTIGSSFCDPVPSQTNNNIANMQCFSEEKMARVLWAWISSGKEVRWSKLLAILSKVGLLDVAMEMETTLHELCSTPPTTTASSPPIYDRLEVTTTMAADYIPHICAHWYLIANILGGAAAVEANGNLQDSSKIASVKMTQILKNWIDSGEDVHWSRLVKALRMVGMGAPADQLEEKLSGSLSQLQSDDKSATVEELPFGAHESVTTKNADGPSKMV